MHVTVLGASGKIGRLLVRRLLADGHSVTAVVYRHDPFAGRSDLQAVRVVKADVHDAAHMAAAIQGSQAVFSTLGSWGTPGKDVLTAAMRAVIPAMHHQGIRRIISLTGADARLAGDRSNPLHWLTRQLLRITAAKVLQDGEEHMRQLQASGLDWTVLRSPVMRSWGDEHTYGVTSRRPLPWRSVHRNDVVRALAEQLHLHSCIAAAPFLNRKR